MVRVPNINTIPRGHVSARRTRGLPVAPNGDRRALESCLTRLAP